MNKVILFGTQPYDRDSFEQLRDAYGFESATIAAT